MTALVIAILYIVGVWVAFLQMRLWSDTKALEGEDHLVLFMCSLISWGIYPLYGLVWLINKIGED